MGRIVNREIPRAVSVGGTVRQRIRNALSRMNNGIKGVGSESFLSRLGEGPGEGDSVQRPYHSAAFSAFPLSSISL